LKSAVLLCLGGSHL